MRPARAKSTQSVLTSSRERHVAARPHSKVFIVLPAYNEEANIAGLLDRIVSSMAECGLPYQLIVVDDGSRDRTAELLDDHADWLPLTVLRHQINQGLGATIRDGLLLAAETASEDDIVITMDADETHTPGLILRMVAMIREGHDVVIASRYQPGARVYGVSLLRRIFSYGASWLFRILFPTAGVKDFTCGFRAYRSSALKSAVSRYGSQFVETSGFQCMVDILLKLRRLNLIFGEAPLILRYDLKRGDSKMHIANTIRQTLTLVRKRRFGF
jgi:dolichol-phosphate mannosyltransferase